MRTIVYADGGADPNPGPGGWGVVIQSAGESVELYGGDKATTNNRMELTAAIRALEHFPEGAAIEMRCDSQYVVKSVTEWIPGWKRRGWRTATGPVKNQELMERLDALASRRDVRWTWVRGHAGEAGNERADQLATLGRREVLGLATERKPPAASRPARLSVTLEAGLATAMARAAKAAGTTTDAFLDDAVNLAIEAGPDGIARLRRAVARDPAEAAR